MKNPKPKKRKKGELAGKILVVILELLMLSLVAFLLFMVVRC